jgi:hypothetical protein
MSWSVHFWLGRCNSRGCNERTGTKDREMQEKEIGRDARAFEFVSDT